MTKHRALLILEIFDYLKVKPNDSFTLDQLISLKRFGDKSDIIESMGYLVGRKTVGSMKGDSFWFVKDLDEESLQELRTIGEVEVRRPEI